MIGGLVGVVVLLIGLSLESGQAEDAAKGKLPLEKTFRTLQLDRFPPVVRQQVEQLRRGTFVDEAINVVAVGRPGIYIGGRMAFVRHGGVAGPEGRVDAYVPRALGIAVVPDGHEAAIGAAGVGRRLVPFAALQQ